jgi:choloylglycine hydrolase
MCTGIRLLADDGAVIHARTMEFAVDIESNVIVVPRGFARAGTIPDPNNDLSALPGQGAKWTSKYASVGANALSMNILVDGLNEKGLAVGSFYFPTCAGYLPFTADDKPRTIAPWEVGSWLLDQFASVEDVRENIAAINVTDVPHPDWHFSPPLHYVVHDASGDCMVIEYVNGQLNLHDNPLGVVTNSPNFDWHMTNLRNYVNFSHTNLPPLELNTPQVGPKSSKPITLVPFGQGSGMLGMPGDMTPPSRFVRAVAFTQTELPAASGKEAVLNAFHILNNFDIPKGAARDHEKDEHGNILADYTIWTTANDLQSKQFYFRTYVNSQIRKVDLMKMNLNAKEIVIINMYEHQETVLDLTPMV